jgi:hypothetical protein
VQVNAVQGMKLHKDFLDEPKQEKLVKMMHGLAFSALKDNLQIASNLSKALDLHLRPCIASSETLREHDYD